ATVCWPFGAKTWPLTTSGSPGSPAGTMIAVHVVSGGSRAEEVGSAPSRAAVPDKNPWRTPIPIPPLVAEIPGGLCLEVSLDCSFACYTDRQHQVLTSAFRKSR